MSSGLEKGEINARFDRLNARSHRSHVCGIRRRARMGATANAQYLKCPHSGRGYPGEETSLLIRLVIQQNSACLEFGRQNIARDRLDFAAQAHAGCFPDPDRNLLFTIHQAAQVGCIERQQTGGLQRDDRC